MIDGLLVVILEATSFALFFIKRKQCERAIDDVVAYTRGAHSLAGTVNPCFIEIGDPDSQ